MGYKKATIHRDDISGLHVHDDGGLKNGEVSVNELRARMDARQQAINDAHKADWPENMTATDADVDHPTCGNAGSRLARPSDVSSKGGDRYGVSETPGEQLAKKAPRDNSKVTR
jgi:hypothetical protein